jgi:tetratricopeptide (TPR) repeat protein
MASSYHQLGMLAQDQGDYPEARREYGRSLEIKEELGDRAGIALSYGQLGVLLTETGPVEEAVQYNLSSFLFHLEVGAPQASINLHWLARQRALLGEERFRTLVSGRIGEQDTAALLQMLDEQGSEQ